MLAFVRRLGGRRVLTDPVMLENESLACRSVRDIRELLTDCIEDLPEDSVATPPLSRLRERTKQYLTAVENLPDTLDKWETIRHELVKLRRAFRQELSELCEQYELHTACELADQIACELRWGSTPRETSTPERGLDVWTRVAQFVRRARGWFGRDKPRVGDLLIVGSAAAVIGGVILAFVLGSSGGGSSHSTSSPAAPATPTSPPKNVRTYAETPGGTVHTWTDYATAEGSPGPLIPAHMTVRVACKVSGFKVPDGDTWWYRIESGPWDGGYYGSADAFYNNGRTSGPLHGTPIVDRSVLDC